MVFIFHLHLVFFTDEADVTSVNAEGQRSLEIRKSGARLVIPGRQNTHERKKQPPQGRLVIVLQLAVTPGLGFVALMRLCENS